ncbi:colon cancer-associated Mic1-like domain-containing protein [Tieghemostelium lacteum]|uniref:Colon cancer-associated Mic1-like domain-containing protein n=1 Tax=Tieghemostelium lacteum TaxID=361077 RepID=A0A151ZJ11_TIELA|nr:colon cancer-associated Mic1-like domain-containing protein [Tieghemostelium lacteum]|eukprot:KYQ93988.1 colon cancer-associated Mic1-like domain-containing protein [Tieghemostelium lacteum]
MSVELAPLPFKIEKGEKFLSYDERLGQVIITSTNGIGFVYLDDPQAKRNYYCSDKPIKDAKFSPNIIYAAIKFSDNDIEILQLKTGVRYTHTCKNVKGSVIMGFFWTNNENLLIITNFSIELYQLADGQCKLIKDTKNLKILNFVFSAKYGVLLIYSGGNQIQPFLFRAQSFDKIPKFTVDSVQSPLELTNLFITRIHEKNYCIYGDHFNINIYELNLETIYKIRTIKLCLPGPNSIHFVDNLIIVHSELKISMVYDLKMIQKDRDLDPKKESVEFPISAIPMSLKELSNNNINSSSGSITSSNRDNYNEYSNNSQQSQQIQLYLKDWEYIHPHYIFERESGNWFEVSLNFDKISNFLQFDSHKIIPFLQDRTLANAKQALLALIKTIIEYKTENLEGIGKIFDELNRVLFQTLNRNNTELLQKQLSSANAVASTTQISGSGSSLSLSNSAGTAQSDKSRSLITAPPSSPSSPTTQSPNKDLWQKSSPQPNSSKSKLTLSNGSSPLGGGGNQIPHEDSLDLSIASSINKRSPTLKSDHDSQSTNNNGSSLNLRSTTVSRTTQNTYKAGNQFVPRASRLPQYILVNSVDMHEKVLYPIYEKIIIDQSNYNNSSNSSSHNSNNNSNSSNSTPTQVPINHHHQQQISGQREKNQFDSKYLISVVTEYIRSLSFASCPASDKLFDLLISLFVDNNMFSQLHQYLQYYAIQDSENIAYKLLSIGEIYPPALQLSLDMFKRLQKPNIIISTLLERKQLLPAIRLLRSIRDSDVEFYQELLTPYSVSLFLKEASAQNNDTLFFSVFKYFENYNHISTANPIFEKYIKLFQEKFGVTHLIYLKKHLSHDTNNSRSNSPKLISSQ